MGELARQSRRGIAIATQARVGIGLGLVCVVASTLAFLLQHRGYRGGVLDYFLTGATGSLGLSLVRLLLESSPETRLYCLVRNPEESPLRSEASGRIQLVQGDVTKPGIGLDKAVWDRLVGRIGRVVHMAANVDFLASLDEARALNVVGTRNVLDFARACLNRDSPHFRVLHVSTAYVCGKATGLLAEASLNPHGEFWNHAIARREPAHEGDQTVLSSLRHDGADDGPRWNAALLAAAGSEPLHQ